MKKQTAVEWLWEQIDGIIPYQDMNTNQQFIGVLEQANEMFKEQSKTDFEKGQESTKFKFPLSSDAYYEETYGK
jgi:hypothetical protein